MKTNKIMIRKMGTYNVQQRTKDGMFDATWLAEQWKQATGVNKHVSDFLRLQNTKEFIEILYSDLHKSEIGDSLLPDNKTRDIPGIVSKTNARTNSSGIRVAGKVWFHPYLFLDFSMWLNPKFKLDVIKFVYDQLIDFRHLVGDGYKGLSSALTVFPDVDYGRVAKGLNYVVFGRHEKELRQRAKLDELQKLSTLQQQLAFAVDMGYIKTFQQLLTELRKLWRRRDTVIIQ